MTTSPKTARPPKTWTIYQVDLTTKETLKVVSLSDSFEDEVLACNRMNVGCLTYGAIYYVVNDKSLS